MAIALDSATSSTSQTSSPLTWTHTCTGSNLLLVVGIGVIGATSQPTVSAVTYNGVSMVKARADKNPSGGTMEYESSVWFLKAPATGSAYTISATFSAAAVPMAAGVAVSYTGVNQTNTPDAVNGLTGTASGAQSFNVTTVANNCWVFAAGVIGSAVGTPTLTATQTSRGSIALSNTYYGRTTSEDLNGPKTPAGAQAMGFTTGGTIDAWAMTGASFAPAGGATTSTSSSSSTVSTSSSSSTHSTSSSSSSSSVSTSSSSSSSVSTSSSSSSVSTSSSSSTHSTSSSSSSVSTSSSSSSVSTSSSSSSVSTSSSSSSISSSSSSSSSVSLTTSTSSSSSSVSTSSSSSSVSTSSSSSTKSTSSSSSSVSSSSSSSSVSSSSSSSSVSHSSSSSSSSVSSSSSSSSLSTSITLPGKPHLRLDIFRHGTRMDNRNPFIRFKRK